MPAIIETKDDFSGKIITEHQRPLAFGTANGTLHIKMKAIQLKDDLSMSVVLSYTGEAWWFLRHGSMEIKADGEIIKFPKPISNDTDVGGTKDMLTDKTTVTVHEVVIYLISKAQLKQICEASKVDIRVFGKKGYNDCSLSSKDNNYFKAFYNKVVDSSSFIEETEAFNKRAKNKGVLRVVGKVITAIIALPLLLLKDSGR